MAGIVVEAINDADFSSLSLPDFTAEARVRSFSKTQDINTLAVHVIPASPETEVVTRGGDIYSSPQVIVCVFDRRPIGENEAAAEFSWHRQRAMFVEAIVKTIDWPATLSEHGCSLSEAEIGTAIFDGVDTDTVFASSILFSFESSE